MSDAQNASTAHDARDVATLSDAFRSGSRSAVEIVSAALEAAADDRLGSFWRVLDERALARAESLDAARSAGQPLGPLAGLPFAAKDCFDVAGLPTSCGIAGEPTRDVPTCDATAIELLESAGAILVARTSMDQLAWGMKGVAPGFPPTRNPADPTRMPGGSSGGSAAGVGSGAVPLALGTDAGGSVRQPAGWCGVVGFKPTLGAIPTRGCAPMAPSLDTVGTLTRTVADQEVAFAALTAGAPVSGSGIDANTAITVGIVEAAFEDADPLVARACELALESWESRGATLTRLELPWARRGLGTIYAAELAASWTDVVDPADERLLPTVRAGLEHGAAVDATSYIRASRQLLDVRDEALEAIGNVDLVAGPTSPLVAPPLTDPDPTAVGGRNTRVFNGLGWPAISLPVATDGLPVGIQLATAPGADRRLLALARQLADALEL